MKRHFILKGNGTIIVIWLNRNPRQAEIAIKFGFDANCWVC